MGTKSIQESEHFSALLTQQRIRHCVLNARNDAEEAVIVAEAGKPHQFTISTNMAGRGVDIRLGGSDEAAAGFVRSAGGLFVVSTGINRSIRIDNQLRGRSGRQGDPGESQFFVCLKDLTLEPFFEIGFYDYKKYPKLLRRAQRAQEGKDAQARYMLERYSRILEEQRKAVTDYRTQILLDLKAAGIVREEDPVLYWKLVDHFGGRGVTIAEKQLTLYFVNINWAAYLAAMEDMKRDVVDYMQNSKITESGIDMSEAGLAGAVPTGTYMINESASQFSRIPYLVKSMSTTIKGTVFTLRGIWARLKRALRHWDTAPRKEGRCRVLLFYLIQRADRNHNGPIQPAAETFLCRTAARDTLTERLYGTSGSGKAADERHQKLPASLRRRRLTRYRPLLLRKRR